MTNKTGAPSPSNNQERRQQMLQSLRNEVEANSKRRRTRQTIAATALSVLTLAGLWNFAIRSNPTIRSNPNEQSIAKQTETTVPPVLNAPTLPLANSRAITNIVIERNRQGTLSRYVVRNADVTHSNDLIVITDDELQLLLNESDERKRFVARIDEQLVVFEPRATQSITN